MAEGHRDTGSSPRTTCASSRGLSRRSAAPGMSRRRRSMLRALDLFSGIGGFALGLERTGHFQTVAFAEIEPYAAAVLARHWPSVRCYPDVRRLTRERLERDGIAPMDVITGGFPCQNISQCGDQTGIRGSKSAIWTEFKRLIGEIRPSL